MCWLIIETAAGLFVMGLGALAAQSGAAWALLEIPCYIIGGLIAAPGAILLLRSILSPIFSLIFGVRKSSRDKSDKKGDKSSSNDLSNENKNENTELKEPDSHVEYLICNEITKRLPPVTPSTGLYCTIYSDSASLSGTITLWYSTDVDKVRSAISDGFNSALQKAADKGYDVYNISGLDVSGVTLQVAST
ncbi:MAG: hypothetical protein ACI4M5_04025 [Christensenellales bacterium]